MSEISQLTVPSQGYFIGAVGRPHGDVSKSRPHPNHETWFRFIRYECDSSESL